MSTVLPLWCDGVRGHGTGDRRDASAGARPARRPRNPARPRRSGRGNEVEDHPEAGVDLGERVVVERADPFAELALVDGDDL